MKKINLPKEAIYRNESEKLWFYEEFQTGGNHAHWKMNLYSCGIVKAKKEYPEDLDWSYEKYLMKFNDGYSDFVFEFRKYLDPIFNGDFAIYLDGCSISEEVEEYSDLAGCCKSAMYYMCTRV